MLKIKDYPVSTDGYIIVGDNIDLFAQELKQLPLKLGLVSRNFDCASNILTSFEGWLKHVVGYFDCQDNKLTNLENSPKTVEVNFKYNQISS